MGPGGANNPHGLGGKSHKSEDQIVTVDNVHVDQPTRPAGNSSDAGLRRLRKEAAAGNERAKAALDDVLAEKTSVHQACVDLGFRKKTLTVPDEPAKVVSLALRKSNPLGVAKQAWEGMSQPERDEFLQWIAGA